MVCRKETLYEKGVMYECMKRDKNVIAITILIMTLLSAAVCNSISVEAAEHTEKSVTVSIPVSCEKVDSEETFQYQIKGAPSEFEEIIQTELGLKSGEKGYFQISYSYPGTYYYTVSQIAGRIRRPRMTAQNIRWMSV